MEESLLDDLENEFDDNDIANLLNIIKNNDENVDYDDILKSFGINIKEFETDLEEYTPKINLKFKKSNPNSITPKYAYISDSGFDLYSVEDTWIFENDRKLIPTGIHLDIPDGYEVQIRSKSGLALNQGLFVLNSPGTIDSGFSGEIQVILFNTTKNRIKIEKGQKIAQAVLCPVVNGKWVELTEETELNKKDRNENGFGSTGIK
jgi:dUTP pyrophosphatase